MPPRWPLWAWRSISASPRRTDVLLDLAGANRAAVVAELLADPRPEVVAVVCRRDDLGGGPDMQRMLTAALLRLGSEFEPSWEAARQLAPEEQLALATAIVSSPSWPQLQGDVCRLALGILGDRKEGALAPLLARGANHPSGAVRLEVASGLGRTFSREAAPFLLELLKDDDDAVKEAANRALDAIANYLDARTRWAERLHRK